MSEVDASTMSSLERLIFSQAVYDYGSEAWPQVSKLISKHPMISRPRTFFTAQSCSAFYVQLMEEAGLDRSEADAVPRAPMNLKLAQRHYGTRVLELKKLIAEEEVKFKRIVTEIDEIRSGQWDDKIRASLGIGSTAPAKPPAEADEAEAVESSLQAPAPKTPEELADLIRDASIEEEVANAEMPIAEEIDEELAGASDIEEIAGVPDIEEIVGALDVEETAGALDVEEILQLPADEVPPAPEEPAPVEEEQTISQETLGEVDQEIAPDRETSAPAEVTEEDEDLPMEEDEKTAEQPDEELEEPTRTAPASPEEALPVASEDVQLATSTEVLSIALAQPQHAPYGEDEATQLTPTRNAASPVFRIPTPADDEFDGNEGAEVAFPTEAPTQEELEADEESRSDSGHVTPVVEVDTVMQDADAETQSMDEVMQDADADTPAMEEAMPDADVEVQAVDEAVQDGSRPEPQLELEAEPREEPELETEPELERSPAPDVVLVPQLDAKRKASDVDGSLSDSQRDKKRAREESEPVEESEPGPSVGPKRRPGRPPATDNPVVSKRFQNVIGMLHSQISAHRNGSIFHHPIRKVEASDYHDIVKRPMDLKTIKARIKDGLISNSLEFQRDVYLMFANAMMYNRPGSEIYNMAEEMMLESEFQMNTFRQTEGFHRL